MLINHRTNVFLNIFFFSRSRHNKLASFSPFAKLKFKAYHMEIFPVNDVKFLCRNLIGHHARKYMRLDGCV